MVEMDFKVEEEFGMENVTRPLVSLLGMDVDLEDFKDEGTRRIVTRLHSMVQMYKDIVRCGGSRLSSSSSSSSLDGNSMEVKLTTLWILARGSLLNSKKITETKTFFVLVKIIEKERGKFQVNCLLMVMELAAVAEFHVDLKRLAFMPNSVAGKAILDQLLRVINEKSIALVILVTKVISCLARTFPVKETRIITPLLLLLNKALKQERELSVLEEVAQHFVIQHPDLRKSFSKAIHQVTLYQIGAHTHIKA
ncbi:unnamed protein product [Fraxinus pennsylvanica]|uniref:Uncharacterized protein n=1 Tax=Fraxinus pennsylvanica TaxID=56036 RepID=A0AAD1YPH4_9LAMI|nr:unnamed protein product [Fraxinus pennsylvanica]